MWKRGKIEEEKEKKTELRQKENNKIQIRKARNYFLK